MRDGFSADFLRACYLAQSTEIFVSLVTITHSGLVEPLRFHNKLGDSIVSNSETYEGRWFEMDLPSELNDSLPQVVLTVDNADLLLSLLTFPLDTQEKFEVHMSIIKKSDPAFIEYGPNRFSAPELACDKVTAVWNCIQEPGLDAMWPKDAITPYSHPATFGAKK